MQDKRTAGIRCRRKRLLLISDDVRVAMMPWRLMAIGPSITAAKREGGRERDEGSHQHDFNPLSLQPPSIENAVGFCPESQVCHIRA